MVLPYFNKHKSSKRNSIISGNYFFGLTYVKKVKFIQLCGALFRLFFIKSALHKTCNFPAQALSNVSFLWEGEPPSPISTPSGAYRP